MHNKLVFALLLFGCSAPRKLQLPPAASPNFPALWKKWSTPLPARQVNGFPLSPWRSVA